MWEWRGVVKDDYQGFCLYWLKGYINEWMTEPLTRLDNTGGLAVWRQMMSSVLNILLQGLWESQEIQKAVGHMCSGLRRGVWARDKDLRVTGGQVVVEGKGMDEETLRCLCSVREEEGQRPNSGGMLIFHEGQGKKNPQRTLRRVSQRGKRKTKKKLLSDKQQGPNV